VGLVVIDVAWTKQKHILPAAMRMLASDGNVISLIKPHYEAEAKKLMKGVLPEGMVDAVVGAVVAEMNAFGFKVRGTIRSPIVGAKGNVEVLAHLMPPIQALGDSPA